MTYAQIGTAKSAVGTTPVDIMGTTQNTDYIGLTYWDMPAVGYIGGGRISGLGVSSGGVIQVDLSIKIGSIELISISFTIEDSNPFSATWYVTCEVISGTTVTLRAHLDVLSNEAVTMQSGSNVNFTGTAHKGGLELDDFHIYFNGDAAGKGVSVAQNVIT